GRGYLDGIDRPRQKIGASFACESAGFDQSADVFLEEKGVPLRPLGEQLLELPQCGAATKDICQELVSIFHRKRIDAQLRIERLAAPAVVVLGPVVDHEENPGGREAGNQSVEKCLCLRVDPVEIFQHEHDRLFLALSQKKSLDRRENLLAPLLRIESEPARIGHRDVEQRMESGQPWLQSLVEA